jgi:hypothetical protein
MTSSVSDANLVALCWSLKRKSSSYCASGTSGGLSNDEANPVRIITRVALSCPDLAPEENAILPAYFKLLLLSVPRITKRGD